MQNRKVKRNNMPTDDYVVCRAPNHPDCVHRCNSGICVVLYDHTTRHCMTGCEGATLSRAIRMSIVNSGWLATTAVQVSGIRVADILELFSMIVEMEEICEPNRNWSLTRKELKVYERAVDISRMVLYTTPDLVVDKRLSFKWKRSVIDEGLARIAKQLNSSAIKMA